MTANFIVSSGSAATDLVIPANSGRFSVAPGDATVAAMMSRTLNATATLRFGPLIPGTFDRPLALGLAIGHMLRTTAIWTLIR